MLSCFGNTKTNKIQRGYFLSSWTSKYRWGDETHIINHNTVWGSRYSRNTNSGWSQEKFYQRCLERGKEDFLEEVVFYKDLNKMEGLQEVEMGQGKDHSRKWCEGRYGVRWMSCLIRMGVYVTADWLADLHPQACLPQSCSTMWHPFDHWVISRRLLS